MNEYERYKCDKCDGTGMYYRCNKNNQAFLSMCPKCDGDGHLDWVENIVGKRRKVNIDTSGVIDIKTKGVAINYPRMHGKTTFLKAQVDIEKEIIQAMSNKIAMEIDEMIISELLGKEKG